MEIRGATGYQWEITRLGRGKVLALSQGPQVQNALKDDRTWTFTSTQTPTGAGDYFGYIKNDSGIYRLMITRITARFAAADVITINGVTGTAAGGTTTAPISRSVGTSKVPTATIQAGADITGLTSTGSLEAIQATAAGTVHLDFSDRPIVLAQNAAIGLLATTGTTAITFFVDLMTDLSEPAVVV